MDKMKDLKANSNEYSKRYEQNDNFDEKSFFYLLSLLKKNNKL